MKRLPILTATLAAAVAAACIWVPAGAFSLETGAPDGAQQAATDKNATDPSASDESTPDESTPDESTPGESTSDESTPGESTREGSASDSAARAVELLQKSRDGLFLRRSVSATLLEKVAVANSTFQASGTYQAGVYPQLRLSYEIQVGKTTGTLLEVCDGQLLWTEQKVQVAGSEKPTVKVSRTVIDDVLKANNESGNIPSTNLIAGMGGGGLPALLASLERSMTFDAIKEGEHNGQPYSVVQGRWNDAYLARLGGADGKPLPEYVPDRVRIYFDQQTLFPTRILYLKKAPAESKLPYRLLLSLEFSDIVLDGPVSEEQFVYVPEDEIQVENRTSKFLEMIEAAKEKAATADDTP